MKNILFIFISVIIFCSCNNADNNISKKNIIPDTINIEDQFEKLIQKRIDSIDKIYTAKNNSIRKKIIKLESRYYSLKKMKNKDMHINLKLLILCDSIVIKYTEMKLNDNRAISKVCALKF
jgi:hypothetical protein